MYIADFKEFQELPIYKFLVTFLKNFKIFGLGLELIYILPKTIEL